jgi:biopolymer transport protein ExbD
MAAAAKDDGSDVIEGINVTPLVDITLVLLIIMMVTARIIVQQQMPMDLPKAAKSTEAQVVFGVDVFSSGDTFVDNKKVSEVEKILPLAKEALAKNPELRVTVRAEGTVPHSKVMRVVDLLKQAGISRIAFGSSNIAPEPGAVPTK